MEKALPFRFFITHPKVAVLEWDTEPNPNLLKQLIGFQKAILKEFNEVSQITQGFRSLMLYHNCDIHYLEDYPNRLYLLFDSLSTFSFTKQKTWQIPVCYEESMAPDIKSLANQLNISTATLVREHTSANYQVNFIGFLPGFLYLSGLPKVLECKRKSIPVSRVDRGSVGIGGKQTGIYPLESPGGWHLIGKTPCPLFEPKKKNPCFAKAGDSIQFLSISKSDFLKLEKQREHGTLKIKPL
jgi:inhibitor of KinA|tara:strand:- start:309 stop:1031 length:723 start_codon:yes stop_codon:yes gene_type:complete